MPDVPSLKVEVVWADITQVPGDVYAVGHYEHVLPQNAERELDKMISGSGAGDNLVLTGLTRRGLLRGAVGDVAFFPWASTSLPADTRGRVVAVVGMGHPGSFGPLKLRRAARNLAWGVSSLPDARTVCTVLIGSGAGNITLADAVYGLIAGIVDAAAPTTWRVPIETLRIVELELGKARAIHRHLLRIREVGEIRERMCLKLDEAGLGTGAGGRVGPDYSMALTVAAAAVACGDPARADLFERLFDGVQPPAGLGALVREALGQLDRAGAADVAALAARLTIGVDTYREDNHAPAPTRLSFIRDGAAICAAALTDTTVIPERRFEADDALVTSAVQAMTDPEPSRVHDLSTFLTRLVVPRDFRELLERAPQVVIEVDRDMARLPWEMLADRVDGSAESTPLALKIEVARQLRTAYSPPPGMERVPRWPLRALVIGDPGDPAKGDALPGARQEALAVATLLHETGVEVTALIGASTGRGGEPVSQSIARRDGARLAVHAASRLDVLMYLMSGEYDLLHYAGHGNFDPQHPDLTGWVFEDGILTSRLLERVDLAPSLVVANACLSARTSNALARGAVATAECTEADLLPGLADEFFRRGVRNYIGTAWEVDDQGAVEFARVFYDALIPAPDAPDAQPQSGATVGHALLRARAALYARVSRYRALWAAYQHYGDPQHVLIAAATAAPPTPDAPNANVPIGNPAVGALHAVDPAARTPSL